MHKKAWIYAAAGALLCLWSAFVFFLYRNAVSVQERSLHDLAVAEARITFEKDLTYRRWVSRAGGIYVQQSEYIKPNPYLRVPKRDLVTADGMRLTMVNPAYMTRMVYAIMNEQAGVQAHITSLKPINPVNAPSPWEVEKLRLFERESGDVHELVTEDGKRVLRFMTPMITEESCLKCHAEQGYRVGEIRGGISVTVPMSRFDAAMALVQTASVRQYGTIWVSGVGFVLFGCAGLVREESFRQRTERQLRDNGEFLKSLYDNSAMGIFVVAVRDDVFTFAGINAAFSHFCGIAAADIVGKRPEDLREHLPVSVLEFLSALFTECVQAGKTIEVEHRVSDEETAVWWMTRVTPLQQPDGRIYRLVGNSIPITSWKQAEEALREAVHQAETASRTKSEFLANMSHEIRTPLNGIQGMLQLLGCTEMSAEQTDYVQAALTSAHRLTRLLSDLLDLSRIEAGRLVLCREAFAMKDIRASVLDIFRLTARAKHISLTFDIDARIAGTLLGDDARLRQILFNLVGNAIKFTETGGVAVHASLLRQEGTQQTLLFTVADTGAGISDDRLPDIFEPFVQGADVYTRRFQGAGLGLSIVRRLILLMSGTMAMDTETGAGTTVCVTLSFTVGRPLSRAGECDAPLSLGGPSPHVLLVEDDAVNRLAGRAMLMKLGCTVGEADDGQKAVDLAASGRFDLVLMDIQMPVLDGVAATRIIRALPGKKGQVPIIALTAYAMAGDREKFMDAGMDYHLTKPISLVSLREAIAAVLTAHKAP